MNRVEAITKLKAHADAIKALGATSLYLFGSSDVFVEYDPAKMFSLVDLIDIKLFLEDELGVAVDVTTRDGLHPMLRDDIETSAIRVF
jgi:predicted nucleotidyltransferase